MYISTVIKSVNFVNNQHCLHFKRIKVNILGRCIIKILQIYNTTAYCFIQGVRNLYHSVKLNTHFLHFFDIPWIF